MTVQWAGWSEQGREFGGIFYILSHFVPKRLILPHFVAGRVGFGVIWECHILLHSVTFCPVLFHFVTFCNVLGVGVFFTERRALRPVRGYPSTGSG